MEQRRRIGAYGVCHDRSGAVLLTRASAGSVRPGTWFLPGGGIEHGEHPADAVVREMTEETGLAVKVVRVRDVTAEVVARPPYLEHTDAVIYDLAVTGGEVRPELGGTTDAARWVPPAELPSLPVSGLAAYTFGLPPPAVPAAPPAPLTPPAHPNPPPPGSGPRPRAGRGQRFAVYGLVADPDERVLLTLIAEGYPGAGRWHLPGGGTDFGEQPVDGLLREITEESGQTGQVGALLTVTHRHTPKAYGPEGRAMDWHAVRAVYRVTVAHPSVPRVTDPGGSTADAAWFTRFEAQEMSLSLTELAAALLTPGELTR